MCLRYKLKMN